jgi:hypothetical protein
MFYRIHKWFFSITIKWRFVLKNHYLTPLFTLKILELYTKSQKLSLKPPFWVKIRWIFIMQDKNKTRNSIGLQIGFCTNIFKIKQIWCKTLTWTTWELACVRILCFLIFDIEHFLQTLQSHNFQELCKFSTFSFMSFIVYCCLHDFVKYSLLLYIWFLEMLTIVI